MNIRKITSTSSIPLEHAHGSRAVSLDDSDAGPIICLLTWIANWRRSRTRIHAGTRFATRSTISLWEQGALFRYQERERATLKLLERNGFRRLDGVKIQDVGCGNGGTLRDFVNYGASPENVAGVDLLENRIESARRLSPHFDLRVANAAELPFPDGAFDLAVTFTMFSSIKDPELRKAVADEIVRVLRSGGALL